MLIVSYNPVLLAAAAVLAIMAGFTGLSLTNGLSKLDVSARKSLIVRAAIVLGGGVWSTHFVAMLALELPVEVFYHPVYTLTSALLAILMAGGSLLLLHFGPRTPTRIVIAGGILGLGVVSMHYVGMYGMRGCIAVFGALGYIVSTVLAILISIGALRVAYGQRTLRGLILGGTIYGLAILVMHFSAMSQTGFIALEDLQPSTRFVPNDVLALLVVFSSFLICGAFLLTTVNVAEPADSQSMSVSRPSDEAAVKLVEPAPSDVDRQSRLPYEKEGKTYFVDFEDVVAIQADGHYTRLYCLDGQVLCPLPISKLAEILEGSEFLRTHRSYLVNVNHVQGFERKKDQAICLFEPELKIPSAPVSRSNVSAAKVALGL